VARLAKCTPRWFQNLVTEGLIPKPKRRRYATVGVVHGRIDSLFDEARRSSQSPQHVGSFEEAPWHGRFF
jgi:hypothetical protein